MDLFVTCSQGLEPLLLEEIQKMGIEEVRAGYRGVYVANAPKSALFRLNYCSRLASRVLLPLSRFPCYEQASLYRGVSKIDWDLYIKEGKTFAIDANVNHPKLRNSLFAAQVVKDAICDQIREKRGNRPSVNVKNPDIQLNLFIHQDTAIVSFDTSGMPLYKRGYRTESVEAPIQESLAAAILTLANFQGTEILCDPCCGSGTLLIEAALMASNTPPGYLRQHWGFFALPDFSQDEWLKVKSVADAERKSILKQHLYGVELNKKAVQVCRANLRTAGFYQEVELHSGDFRDYKPEVLPNLIVTNPPHGRRLEDVDSLFPLYRALGDFMKRETSKPARGYVFTGSMELAKEVGLAAKRRYVLNNGGIESRLLEFDLY